MHWGLKKVTIFRFQEILDIDEALNVQLWKRSAIKEKQNHRQKQIKDTRANERRRQNFLLDGLLKFGLIVIEHNSKNNKHLMNISQEKMGLQVQMFFLMSFSCEIQSLNELVCNEIFWSWNTSTLTETFRNFHSACEQTGKTEISLMETVVGTEDVCHSTCCLFLLSDTEHIKKF